MDKFPDTYYCSKNGIYTISFKNDDYSVNSAIPGEVQDIHTFDLSNADPDAPVLGDFRIENTEGMINANNVFDENTQPSLIFRAYDQGETDLTPIQLSTENTKVYYKSYEQESWNALPVTERPDLSDGALIYNIPYYYYSANLGPAMENTAGAYIDLKIELTDEAGNKNTSLWHPAFYVNGSSPASPSIDINPQELSHLFNQLNGHATDFVSVANTGNSLLKWDAGIGYEDPSLEISVPSGPLVQDDTLELSLGKNPYRNKSSLKDRETVVLHYDGDNFNGVGVQGGGSLYSAVRFKSSMVSPYTAYLLESVDVYMNGNTTSASLIIWGQGTSSTPGPVLCEQSFSGTGWVTVNLTEPIEITGTDIWVGYRLSHPEGVKPAGIDAGPASAYGNWISSNGSSWNHLSKYDIDGNWNIRANLTANDYSWLSIDPASGVICSGQNQEISVDYNTDGLEEGSYTANILIKSNDPDKPETNIPVSINILVGIDENPTASILIYPNPAGNTLKFTHTDKIKTIRLTNLLGAVLLEKSFAPMVTSGIINSENIPNGTYCITFITANNKPYSQKIIVKK